MALCFDAFSIIANFIPENFKTFRLVSKEFSKIVGHIDLLKDDSLWLCKLYIIKKKNFSEIKKHLLTYKDELLIWCAKRGHLDAIKYLIYVGVNPQAQDNQAIIWASRKSHLEVVKYLISIGCKLH